MREMINVFKIESSRIKLLHRCTAKDFFGSFLKIFFIIHIFSFFKSFDFQKVSMHELDSRFAQDI